MMIKIFSFFCVLPFAVCNFFLVCVCTRINETQDKSIPDATKYKKTDEPVPDDLIGDGPQVRNKSDLDEPTPLNTQESRTHGKGDNNGADDGVNNSPRGGGGGGGEGEDDEDDEEYATRDDDDDGEGAEDEEDDGEIINAKESRGTESEDETEHNVQTRTETVTASVAATEGTRKRKPRRE